MIDYKKEIELAIKRENPNWDGKSFDYGVAIYKNVEECYEAILPLIKKAEHSGMSYGFFVNIFKRLLDGKVLTPITEEDFIVEFPKESGLQDRIDKQSGTITRQCTRYSSIFRDIHKDGTISYIDVNRIRTVDQYGMGWGSGLIADRCKDLIPEIKLPYMPTDHPIDIFVWEFCYDKERDNFYLEKGYYNAFFIDKIVFPNGKIVQVNRLFLNEHDDKPTEYDDKFFAKLKKFIEKDVKMYKRYAYKPRDKKGRFIKRG